MNEKLNRPDLPTVDRIRADIASGATGEKIGFPDPAAAPLGTDDEAAGTPASPEARRMEARAMPVPVPPLAPSQGPIVFFFGVAAVLAIAIVAGAYLLV